MGVKHKVFYKTFRLPVILYLKLKFGYKREIAKDLPDNYIVLSNHTTDYDPLFVAASFKRQMYFVASEHITRWKKLYAFLRFAFAPIIRLKATVAGSTVVQILRKTKRGENVCVFAEGVRSWDGVTGNVLPSTGQLVKRAGCGLVTYRIIGGYHINPVWSNGPFRKGAVKGEVVGIYTAQQLKELSDDQVNEIIKRDLYVNAFEGENTFDGKNIAHGLERLIYLCPGCGAVDSLRSNDDKLECQSCKKSFTYENTGKLEGVPLKVFSDFQKSHAHRDIKEGKGYGLAKAFVYEIDKQSASLVTEGAFEITPDEISCGTLKVPSEQVGDMAIFGKDSIVFSCGNKYYEIKTEFPCSAYKILTYYKALKDRGGI